jgi:hypothetical protein
MAVQIQLRNGSAAQWTSANPILAVGEMGVETDTNRFKIGTGTTAWNILGYSAGFAFKGPWSSGTSYVVNDVVSYNGSSYISIQNGTNQNPSTQTTYWSIVASQGDIGVQGNQGFQGAQGQGNQGFQGAQGQGNQGFQGAQGQGNQGFQGFQGTAGSQGDTGVQGNQGFQGSTGLQGFQGEVITVSYIFDGGSPSTNYSSGPTFDCGGVI